MYIGGRNDVDVLPHFPSFSKVRLRPLVTFSIKYLELPDCVVGQDGLLDHGHVNLSVGQGALLWPVHVALLSAPLN